MKKNRMACVHVTRTHVDIIKGDENDYVWLFCHTHNNGRIYIYIYVHNIRLYMYTCIYGILYAYNTRIVVSEK